jgi:F0F1-type ATP synthase assembly protein I
MTQERILLAVTIVVLVAATAINLAHSKTGLAALSGGVLIAVVVVRVILPALGRSDDSDRR